MNKFYRSIWNDVTQTFVAVAEGVRARGKRSSSGIEPGATPAAQAQARPMALEQRFMFDAAGASTLAEARHAGPDAHDAHAAEPAQASAALLERLAELAPQALQARAPTEVRALDPALNGGRREAAFIDTGVAGYQTLIDGIRPGVEVLLLDAGEGGLAQIAQWASTHAGYDAIHLLSHGSEGVLHLGRDTLTADSLDQADVQAELQALGQALTADGDLLIYGCDFAQGAGGQALLASLAAQTSADVAASTDATGAAARGGNWVLERQVGQIDVAPLDISAFTGDLAYSQVTFDFSSYDLNYTNHVRQNKNGFVLDGTILNASNSVTGPTVTGGRFTDTTNSGKTMRFTFSTSAVVSKLTVGYTANSGMPGDLTVKGYVGGTLTYTTTISSPNANQDYTLDLAALGWSTALTKIEVANTGAGSMTFYADDIVATPINPAPTDLQLSSTNAPAGIAGARIANIRANDSTGLLSGSLPANANYSYATETSETFSIVADPGGLFAISGNVLSLQAGKSLANGDTANVTIRATDSDGSTYDKAFTITGTSYTALAVAPNGDVAVTYNGTWTGESYNGTNWTGGSSFSANDVGFYVLAPAASGADLFDNDYWDSLSNTLAYYNNGDILGNVSYASGAAPGVDTFAIRGQYYVVTVGTPGPTVTDARISITSTPTGTGSTYKVGDTVTARWDNSTSGDNQAGITGVTVDFSQFGGGSAVTATNDGSGHWTASYTLTAGGIDATNRNVSVTASTASGSTTTADSTNLTVDNQAPTVTNAQISISSGSGTGGAFKIGDTVTATWNNSAGGDNNSDTISSVAVDFSQFGGGSAVAASNTGGVWTATYVVTAGNIDTTNRNVSVTATDNAGNTTTTADATNATVDNIAPTVTDAQISISGGSGPSGAFVPGDIVTATWNNTAGGDNNSDTISSVTVDFSQFGGGSAVAASNTGGVWTATYVVTAGSIDASNRNVSVTVTDNAGNTTTTADSSNATVHTTPPTTTVSSVALSADTGASSSDFITNTAAQTISGTLSANLVAGEAVYVSLDNGTTWTAATTSVGSNAWSLAGMTLSGSNTLKARVSNAAGNGATYSQAYALDTTAPTTPSTPNLTAGTDSGSSSSDDITATVTPVFTGTAEVNSTVTLYDTDGTTVLGTTTAIGGNWSITSSTLSEGSHTLTAKATDVAGNVSAASAGLVVTIDTVGPTSLALSTTSAPDLATGAGATVATLSATDATAVSYGFATGNGVIDADNASFTISGNELRSVGSLSVGSYHIYLSATDAAGNSSYQFFTFTVTGGPQVASIVRAGGAAALTSAGSVSYVVSFSEAVTGVDASDFTLTTSGSASGTISSVTGSGDTYTVTVDNAAGDGMLRLDLNASGTGIANGMSQPIVAGYTAGQTYTFDHTRPTASIVVADTALRIGETSLVTITFSEAVTGFTNADLTIANGTLSAISSSDGGITWTATLAPTANLQDATNVITLDNTGVADAAGNAGSGTTDSNNYAIDTQRPTAALSLASTSLNAGQSTTVTITFSEAVTGFTLADMTAQNGTLSNLSSSDGGVTWTATLTPTAGLEHTGNVITLDNTGVADAAGNAGSGTTDSPAYAIDTLAPTVTSVAVPANGTYASGQALSFTVNLSEAVVVDITGGTPRIALVVGSTVRHASYVSGSGGTALVFSYVTQAGDLDGNGITVGALGANGGTLRDLAGNDVTLTLNSVGSTAAVLVDAIAPAVTGVAVPADGYYRSGQSLDFTVGFSEAVTVDTSGGTPRLALAVGTATVYADYVSGSGTTALVFRHVVQAGEVDIDGLAIGALQLQGGSLQDATGNAADTTLAGVAATGGVRIDAVAPASISLSATSAMDVDTGPGVTLATLTAQDDTALTYALATGNGSNDSGNASFTVSGTSLRSAGALAGGSYQLYLSATDQAGNVSHLALTFTIGHNSAPVITSGSTASVAENVAAGTVVYQVIASDADAGQTLHYSLSGADAALLAIDASTGTVTIKASPDHEARSSYHFDVTATDDGPGALSDTRSVTLAITDVDEPATGALLIQGTAREGEVLSLADTLADPDGIVGKTYQWFADGVAISGATGTSLTLDEALIGKAIAVEAHYTDNANRDATVTSAATAAVVGDSAPVITSGSTASVAENVAAGTVVYQVVASDADAGQTLHYSLSGPDAALLAIDASTGTVTIKAAPDHEARSSYHFDVTATDDGPRHLSATRSVTLTITDVDEPATGALLIQGTAREGEVLSLADTLADPDGIVGKTYQWFADGVAISGATGTSLTLTQAQVGKAITVAARYTDNASREATVASAASAVVANVNDAPTGTVGIAGTAEVGQVLTAGNTLADADGLGTVQYQWQYRDASGQWHDLATGERYTVDGAHAGQALRVLARYTDGQGTAETVASDMVEVALPFVPPPAPVPAPTPVVVPDIPAPPPTLVPVISAEVPAIVPIALGTPLTPGFTVPPSPLFETAAPAFRPEPPAMPLPDIGRGVVGYGSGNAGGVASLTATAASHHVELPASGGASYTLPADSFIETDPNSPVTLTARLADGRPLPAYVSFDPTTGTLEFAENSGGSRPDELVVVVIARDAHGREARTSMVVKFRDTQKDTGKAAPAERPGKPALSAQLRALDRPADLLARLAALGSGAEARPRA